MNKILTPKFSIILPTYNRAFCIANMIDSILAQTYPKFELIVIDDGSTDNTEELLNVKYKESIDSEKIVYVKSPHVGVCKARNLGLKTAKNEWITYADSDDSYDKNFLMMFVAAIGKFPKSLNFYCQMKCIQNNKITGKPFNLKMLIKANYIGTPMYVHKKSLIDELGGFDENMTRLVDWELIVRQCKKYTPQYINSPLVYWNNGKNYSRITTSADIRKNMTYFRKKHPLIK